MKKGLRFRLTLVIILGLMIIGINFIEHTGNVITRTGDSDVNITISTITDSSYLNYNTNIPLNFSVVNSTAAKSACWYTIDAGTTNTTIETAVVPETLGDDSVSNGDFSQAEEDWKVTDASGYWILDSGGAVYDYHFDPGSADVSSIEQDVSVSSGETYNVTYTISDWVNFFGSGGLGFDGSLVVTVGGEIVGTHNDYVNGGEDDTYSVQIVASSTANLTFEVTGPYDPDLYDAYMYFTLVDVSVQEVIAAVPAVPCTNTTINVSEGIVNLTVYGNDSSGNVGSYSTTFTVDLTNPLIELVNATAVDNANLTQNFIYVNVSATETNEDTITFNLYNDTGEVNSTSFTDATRSINWTSLAYGNYTYNVTINDSVGKSNYTATRTINISAAAVEETTTNSGSTTTTTTTKFWTNTYLSDKEEFSDIKIISRELKAKHQIQIKINDETHHVGVIQVTDKTATINISSTPQQATLSIGEEKKFDANEDDYYDIFVKLNGIDNDEANITLESIHEKIPQETPEPSPSATTSEDNVSESDEAGKKGSSNEMYYWIGGIVIIFLVMIIWAFVYKKFNPLELEGKEKSSQKK